MLAKFDELVQRLLLGRPANHKTGVLLIYTYLDHFMKAIESTRATPVIADQAIYYSPTSYHEVEHACGYGFSPVRWFTLVGGLTGVVSGVAICLFFDFDWPMVVGGKTPGLFSAPVWVIICFELAILLGGIATIIGMLVFCRIPNPKAQLPHDELTDDKFGVFLPSLDADNEVVKKLMTIGKVEIKKIGKAD